MNLPGRNSVDSEIPTSSMADIAFLLIVFFMVTTTFAATKGLDFKIPADSDESAEPESAEELEAVYIKVTGDGVLVDCQPMELNEILPYLKPKLEAWPDKPVILHTDLNAQYGDMVQVYDELAKGNTVLGRDIKNISIPTSKEIERYVEIFGFNPFEESCQ